MEIFNTPICPECGSKHSIEYMDDSGDSHLHPDNDLIQAEMDAEQAREMAELSGDDDPEMLDLLYADGIIDEYEWWERKHG